MAYNNSVIIPAIVFCLGAVIDEAQKDDYIARRSCSGARKLLLMKWMVVGFFFTMCYKSYMRAMMIKIDYEKTIDTIDDMLMSEIPIKMVSNTHLPLLLANDPRETMKALANKIEYYEREDGGKNPDWIEKGYIFKQLCAS